MTEILQKIAPTERVDVFVAGDHAVAKELCREFCMRGLCVTVEPTTYIYTGGEEAGVRVGLINYPRFPSAQRGDVFETAQELGETLMKGLHQMSYTVVADDETHWFSRRPEDLRDYRYV